MLAHLNSQPGVVASSEAPFRIGVRGPSSPTLHVRLDGMYSAHHHGELDPAEAASEIALAVDVVRAEADGAPAPGTARPLGVAGPFPRLYRRAGLPDLPPATVLRPCAFDESLVIGYVRLLPHGELPVTLPEVAQRWPLLDELHALALANLDDATAGCELEGMGWGAELVMGFSTGDGLDAARALLGERLRAAQEWIVGGVLVAVPSRDMLMMFSDSDAAFVDEALAHTREVYASSAERLSDKLYRLGGDGLEAYQPS